MKVKISKPSVSKVINKKQSNVNSPGFCFLHCYFEHTDISVVFLLMTLNMHFPTGNY